MLKKVALVFGVVFTLVGVLGFVPGITNDEGLLLGIFQVDGLHNVIHLLSGLAGLAASSTESYSQLYLRVFGAVYAAVTIVGFVQGDTVLGLIEVNAADNLLHLVLTVGLLGAGFGLKREEA